MPRYIIVLDRYGPEEDYSSEYGEGGHDGSDGGAMAQVARELQAAIEETGNPAGFFNVVARLPDTQPCVAYRTSDDVLAEVRAQLDRKYAPTRGEQ